MKIYAHRGYSARYPENTVISFSQALKHNCQGIECDVQLTRDLVPVIIHDETVKRTALVAKRLVSQLTYEEMKTLDFSAHRPGSYSPQRIMTLQELLILIKESKKDITLNLELKNSVVPYEGLEDIVLREVKGFENSIDVLYSSFNHDSIRRLNAMGRGLKTAPLVGHSIPNLSDYVKKLGSSGVHLAQKLLTARILNDLLDNGLFVNVYTVNSLAMARRYQEMNVTGIFTDRCVEIKEEITYGKKSGPDQTRWSKTKSHRRDYCSL